MGIRVAQGVRHEWPAEPCVNCGLPTSRLDLDRDSVRLHRLCVAEYDEGGTSGESA